MVASPADTLRFWLSIFFLLVNTHFLTNPTVADFAPLFAESTAASAAELDGRPVDIELEFYEAASAPQPGWTEATAPSGFLIYLAPTPSLTSDDVAGTAVLMDGMGLSLFMQLTEAGALKMADVSERLIGQPLAIVFEGEVVSAPVIQAAISDKAVIALARESVTPDLIEALALTPEELGALR